MLCSQNTSTNKKNFFDNMGLNESLIIFKLKFRFFCKSFCILTQSYVVLHRMLIAFLENNLNADGTVSIPKPLHPYMGEKELLVPNKK